jgi:divalent metal cation (Fe/Co/Zn/Cd) transporter
MFTATLQLVVETIQQLVTGETHVVITAFTLAIIAVTVVVKFFLWVYCTSISTKSSSVHALAVDHRNDVFTNMFGMTTAILGRACL